MPIFFSLLTICSIFTYSSEEDYEGLVLSKKLMRTYSKHGSWAEAKQKNRNEKRLSVQFSIPEKKEESKGTLTKSFIKVCKKVFTRSSSFNPDATNENGGPVIVEPLSEQDASSKNTEMPWKSYDNSSIANQRPRSKVQDYEIILPAAEMETTIIKNSKERKVTKFLGKSASFSAQASPQQLLIPNTKPKEIQYDKIATSKNETVTRIKYQFFDEKNKANVLISAEWFNTLFETYRELPLFHNNIYTINKLASEVYEINPQRLSEQMNKHATNLDVSSLSHYIAAFNSINKLAQRMNYMWGSTLSNSDLERTFIHGAQQMPLLSDPLLKHFGNEYVRLMTNQLNVWHSTSTIKFSDTFANALTKQKELSKLKPITIDYAFSLVTAKEKERNRKES